MNDKKTEHVLGFSLNDKYRANNSGGTQLIEYICKICGRKKGEYDPREEEFNKANNNLDRNSKNALNQDD